MTQVTKKAIPVTKPVAPVNKGKVPVAAKQPPVQPAASESDDDDFFSEANSVKMSYFKAETIGDSVKGVLVDRFIGESNLTVGQQEESYILVQKNGERVCVKGRGRRKSDGVKVIFGMEKIPLGAIVGFIYTDDKDTGQLQPAKIIEIRYKGETDPEALKKYQKMFTSGNAQLSSTAPASAPAEDGEAVTDPALPSFNEDGE